MSGITKITCVGGQGGFQGADGVNPITLQILVGDGGRQWLEPHYFDTSIKPLGDINVIIPPEPDYADALLDACIAFYPRHFQACSLLSVVDRKLKGKTALDFDLGEIPTEWAELREQARPMFAKLNIWGAELRRLDRRAAF